MSTLSGETRGTASGYGQFVLAAVGLVIMLVGPVKRMVGAAPLSVEEQLAVLAAAVRDQWAQEAAERGLVGSAPLPVRWRRSTAPVAGPASAAVRSRTTTSRFTPLPGFYAVTTSRLREGSLRTLRAVLGGLDSGRLLLVGEPGSGKSAAVILLLLDLVRHRDEAEHPGKMPVPVMFTLHGWNPDRQSSPTGQRAGSR